MRLRDEPGGSPFTGQAVSGMEAARVRSAASAWNVGRRMPTLPPGAGRRWGREERAVRRKPEALSTVAASAGGPARSSGEAPV